MAISAARGKLIGVIGDEVSRQTPHHFSLNYSFLSSNSPGYLRWISSRWYWRDEQEQTTQFHGS
jgi:hypothetical protein